MTDLSGSQQHNFSITSKVYDRFRIFFLASGLVFLLAGLLLFGVTGLIVFNFSSVGLQFHSISANENGKVADAEVMRFVSTMVQLYMPLLVCFVAALICALIGTRILRASGIATTQVIAPQDYQLLGQAIASGNEKAIDLWVRLSSLSGFTGTFTKIGLSGLPLATIVLTLALAFCGLFKAEFFDLAKLTLGAFLGSFVQRQSANEQGRAVARQAAEEAVRNVRPADMPPKL